VRDIYGINIYMLNAKILLQEIYEDEKESGERIIFADNALACEKRFTGMIAGSYKITGFRTDWPISRDEPRLLISSIPKRKMSTNF